MNSKNTIADQIRNLVATAQFNKAIDLFVQSDFPEATSIKKRFDDAQLRQKRGEFSFSDYNIVRNNIMNNLLEALDGEKPSEISNDFKFDARLVDLVKDEKPKRTFLPAEKERIKQFLDKNQLEQALAACYDLGDKFLVLASSYTNIKRNYQLGLITTSQRNTAIAEIKEAINLILT
jgi:hypothetical protein